MRRELVKVSNLTLVEYERINRQTRDKRMKWWREARLGMFIHYGLYSVRAKHEWAWAIEGLTCEEYIKLADNFNPNPGCVREWVKFAKKSGAKYCVLTARHHEGFSLWNSKVNPFNSVNYGPKRDLVREYVDACREFDIKIGIYNSLMDWYNPDGYNCHTDSDANYRFTKYLKELNRELMTNYGKIDLLWYDGGETMEGYEGWDALNMNQMIRELQPDIIINNRSRLAEDYGTPEGKLEFMNRDWEACMTFNDISWGYVDSKQMQPYSYNPQRFIRLLGRTTSGGGNLLVNMGPSPDGSIPSEMTEPMNEIGKWLEKYGDYAIYGQIDHHSSWTMFGTTTSIRKGNKVYLIVWLWPQDGTMNIGGFKTKLLNATITNGNNIEFTQDENKITLHHLPVKCPDDILGISVIELEFQNEPVFPDYYRYGNTLPQIPVKD